MMQNSSKLGNRNIGLMAFPLRNPDEECGQTFISQLVDIIAPSVKEVFIITANLQANMFYDNVSIVNVKSPIVTKPREPVVSKAFRFLLAQLTLSRELIRLSSKIDIIILFLNGSSLLLPPFIARLLKKKIVLIVTASVSRNFRVIYSSPIGGRLYPSAIRAIEHFNYLLVDKIIIYSKSVKNLGLRRYIDKICIAHRHFLNFNNFKIKKRYNERDNLVGYIGRLSEEKGVLNFIRAISKIVEEQNEIKFLIGGDGQSRDEIEKYLDENDLNDKVELTAGRIPHDEIPDYLNRLKLIVIPSYMETGPLIAVEAIACGTPVLATLVGSVPDVIKDGETGFILKNNSPEYIAKNIIRALNHPNLDRIVDNANELVGKEFTYEAAVEKYRKILENIR